MRPKLKNTSVRAICVGASNPPCLNEYRVLKPLFLRVLRLLFFCLNDLLPVCAKNYLIKELAAYLTENVGKGFSADNLKLMRRFYVVYSQDRIGKTVFPQSENLPVVASRRKFYLSWSHYLKLMRIGVQEVQ